MGRKKRQFIDKKKSVTFHLEPNAFGDEDANDEAVVADASTLTTSTADYDRKQWELGELGFPDDGYDYSQHMRTIGEGMFIPAIPGSKSDGSSKEFVPDEKVVIYKKNVQKKQQQKQAPTSSVRDLDSLPTAVSQPLGDAATTVIADDDGELDAELLESMHVVAHDENAAEALQDDFVLLANEGLRNAVSLTEDNLTRAQRAARADYLAEMMSSDDDDDDADLFNDPYIDSDADLDEFERIARSDDDEYANDDDDDNNHAYDARSESARGWAGKSVRTAYTRYTRSEAGKTMRSEALQTLDQRFDEFEKQYTDDQIGDLEEEADDIAGEADAALLAEVMNEFLEETRTERVHVAIDDTLDDELKQTTLRLAQQQLAEPDAPLLSATASRANALAAREAPAWDAQSYTSLFSTTENHPSIIDAPRSNKAARRRASKADAPAPGASTEEIVRFRLTKSGMPIAGLPPRKPTDNDNNGNNDDNDDAVVQGQARPADETRAEKAARKQAVKEARRAARQRKKQSRVAHRHHDTVQANALAHQGPKKLNM